MSERINRKNIAEDTLEILSQGFFISANGERIEIATKQQFAEENTVTYSPEISDNLIANRQSAAEQVTESGTQITVTGETTLDAVRRLIKEGEEDVVCLNFASAKNPGGGFLGGSQAQEESIARSTGLYNCLLKADEYYQTNRNTKSCFYTDYMIYSPAIPIIKDEAGNNLDALYTTAVITAPAVNRGVVKSRESERLPEVESVMKRRIEKVLAIALAHKHKTIVLGAWGCGVFQNDPVKIASYFKEVIDAKFENAFSKIVFAVYSRNERFIKPFQMEFGG